MFKGAIHLHSVYSDGEFTLTELREALIAAGCSFACMTDHAEYFDRRKARDYVVECASLSDDDFRFIPGFEYSCCDRMHVLGLGVTETARTQNPQEVIRLIALGGGVSIIAHPKNEFFSWIETFDELPNGIETWNSKYDGRYAPRVAAFKLLERLQRRKPEMRAYYGLDLHWRIQYRGLLNLTRCRSNSREEILGAFAHGDYQGVKDDLTLPSDGRLPESLLASFEVTHARSDRMRRAVGRVKHALKKFGVNVPAPLRAQLRRIF
ncbi:MAG TPA: PHP domain-containing protein [Blastocatellia bacterium]|nr:PHP domain-containing protein [Blastocatellia bacterium]